MKYITRTVWVLSLVSLFTDAASEMLYPIMPIYLKSIGFSIVLIGILEGFAEATAGFSKGYFGKLSDNAGKRIPFVQIGYAFSAISKPMMAIFIYPIWIFFARTIDRFGKGIRTGARDALLSDEATSETKGQVFGFHRSMDTLGAVIGPSLALIYLYFYPQDYKTLFFIAFIPGLLAVLASFFLKEKVRNVVKPKSITPFFSFLNYWKVCPPEYRKLVIGLLAFTLFNSSDIFLLLKAKQSGLNDTMVIGVYIFYNLIYALFAFPIGIIADKVGLKNIFVIGLILFSLVYLGMSANTNLYLFFVLFFLYGIYASATEGISKAWISNITDKKDTATAIGTFSGLQSICAMIASSMAGIIWFKFGGAITFLITAIATIFVVLYILTIPKPITFFKGTN
ncbi:MAG: MFS transporter [Saprospiraceae bacterium]|jgi:MFS family permease|uniref:MFS transporter n=1 Tax=Candidatus Brachybacter algidus TaxID=2982024 RepID=UPI001B467C06|nr:MFS transporter [Candidatus Brachybacter algidus]MBP7305779.1 MFS transporter [Saprospiraceae bacterium]MBK6447949.1 MFS transporter [Candidatus Brachybacter algidus]MBK7602760.1 MFS transporter [Candidatus Brachybacter algidus]MBK8844761.1 MFS transporter [Candidatus Brachybacter algidus]MBK9024725.1 MFS transporter [Candidatus Brachybacter algidus]